MIQVPFKVPIVAGPLQDESIGLNFDAFFIIALTLTFLVPFLVHDWDVRHLVRLQQNMIYHQIMAYISKMTLSFQDVPPLSPR
jgi:hypothetical protein